MAIETYNYEREPVPGGDATAANYGATSIPKNRIVLLDPSNTMTSSKPKGVKLPTASGGVAGTYGVTVDELFPPREDGTLRPGRVAVEGAIRVPADGAITAGDYVQASDTADKLGYAKVCAAGVQQAGQAETTVADGDWVLVRMAKSRNA
jgi:hypothetical protein